MFARRWPLLTWFRAHPIATDALLAAAFAVASVGSLFFAPRDLYGTDVRDTDALGVLLALATAVPLAFRRRYPIAVLSVVGWATTALALWHYLPGPNGISVVVALYTVGTCSRTRESVVAVVISEFFVALSIIKSPQMKSLDARQEVATAVVNVAAFAAVWIFGRYMRTRRAYIAEVEARAAQSDRERAAQTRAALAEERERIAREMHDVVAHHVTVMVVSASAARRTMSRDAAQAGAMLESIESSGRAALTEMRRIVGYLRDDEGEVVQRTPQCGLASLDAVVRSICDAGVPVEVRVIGTMVDLPPTVDTTAFRVVQESLTNVLKHAAPASARLTIRYDDDAVVIHVVDDGAPRPDAPAPTTGHGLAGMRERVMLVGGVLRAGPLPSGGFDVHVRLPLAEAVA
ncbi:MAG: two-component sensor histidine kinase [Frankiales bacterium]|nr:two-component sensor histidine kinase [Frankiales bacterium]